MFEFTKCRRVGEYEYLNTTFASPTLSRSVPTAVCRPDSGFQNQIPASVARGAQALKKADTALRFTGESPRFRRQQRYRY